MNVVRISDGLGNQMFQYAFARKLGIVTGRRVCLDARFVNNEDLHKQGDNMRSRGKLAHREYGLAHFNIRLPAAGEGDLSAWRYMRREGGLQKAACVLAAQGMWPWRLVREDPDSAEGLLPSGAGMMLPAYYQGYFFDREYYDDIKGTLQRELSLKEKIRLPRGLRGVLAERETVSVHVRRGDFLKLGRDISASGYYKRAAAVMEGRIASPVYLIFSDDIGWVRENMDMRGEKLYVSGTGLKDYEELAVMKHCRHNIIANSTFSYWAAYLNRNPDKHVICPKNWKSRIIPREWVKL